VTIDPACFLALFLDTSIAVNFTSDFRRDPFLKHVPSLCTLVLFPPRYDLMLGRFTVISLFPVSSLLAGFLFLPGSLPDNIPNSASLLDDGFPRFPSSHALRFLLGKIAYFAGKFGLFTPVPRPFPVFLYEIWLDTALTFSDRWITMPPRAHLVLSNS